MGYPVKYTAENERATQQVQDETIQALREVVARHPCPRECFPALKLEE